MPDLLTSDPLAALIPLIAAFGVMTPMIATFLERFVPVLPSYAVLVVIGVAAADGSFSLPAALALSLVGSTLGCLSLYLLGRAVGERRSRRFIEGAARLIGISPEKYRLWEDRLRSNQRSIAFLAQLIPTVRLISPGISGLLHIRFWQFAGATALGAALWNGLFIGVGYAFALVDTDANAPILALKTAIALVIAEGLAFWSWRWKVRAR
ncbi:membrane protein DedA with SNARE-associated domain [Rhizobium sp. BK212]|uniref:DedA family protein n=1 Tax=Rhizobium sp. BK212 TaxID=2587074 RepID=UPI001612539D|nr:VTT domain-containing protein [Rhizobium sp. BK212]MBB4215206.1 membrane protein DedA with SNARE-associated domain [Rhizobium sp. BK212]